ncbi:hypothetical protein HO151_03640 [Streptomyces sp. 8P21H-1]|nr:hypothetical protein [Streptomyces sp. 8P21H-1]
MTGPAPAAVGQPAREHALALHELTPVRSASEDVCTAGTTVAVPGFREALAFEWTKFASLRSTPWTTPAVTAVVVVMLPSLFGPLLGDLQRWIVGATPAAALQKLSQTSDASPETAGSPGAWPSPGLVTAYTVLALLVAAGLLRRRDV